MKLIKVKNYNELSEKASDIVINEVLENSKAVLGFATGVTPLGLYKNLVEAFKKRKVDFSGVKTFNLDEYYPIKKTSKNSYHYYMHKNLYDKINVKKENVNLFDGEAKNSRKECERYKKELSKVKIDLQILGVGVNGHVGYNEPGSTLNSKTRLINLSEETIKSKLKQFRNKKNFPLQALTIGIKNIMSAKKLLLLASGKEKKEAIKHLIYGKVSSEWPVSFLRKHKNLTVIVDFDV